MAPTSGVILCIAYILGLLCTAIAWGGLAVLSLGIAIAVLFYSLKSTSYRNKLPSSLQQVKPQLWLLAGLIGFLATVYFQIRIPQPGVSDVSKFVTSNKVQAQVKIVTVRGNITSTPRVTRNQRGQFWLEASQLDIENLSKEVTGNLYVTVPLLQVTGLHEGAAIAITGSLYKPRLAANPGGFDFQAYLAQEGGFAGLKGREVILLNPKANSWGWWAIRQRIIHSQGLWLGMPEAPLVSAMVLGNKVVDVPFNITDSFITVGLAHALAASGFQVSLILSVVLNLTKSFSSKIQFGLGVTALLVFLGLTGFQPSVLRAVLMGSGALIALLLQRKTKPLGLILLAATILLLFKPIWIWDLGFDFSFLATLGLVITVPTLIKRLDWLPPAIATLIAVPIAAYIWTLPLQLYKFGLVSPYSILVNIITTIPLSIISLGAFISAIAALFFPTLGSAIALGLYYPTHELIAIVDYFSHLPGSTVALGTISIIQLIALYGIIALVCIHRFWQQRWWVAGLIGIVLVLIPVCQTGTTIRVTVLATGSEPVVVIQDRGKVLLINTGNTNNARFTVLPFLQQQGVNQIDWAIATNDLTDNNSDWWQILQRLLVKNFYSCVSQEENSIVQIVKASVGRSRRVNYEYLNIGQKVATASTSIEVLNNQIPQLQMQIQGKTWLMLGKVNSNEQKRLVSTKLPHADVLLWGGKSLDADLVKAVQPEIAIAMSPTLDSNTMAQLRQNKAQVFVTGKDGAVTWTPDGKFDATVETTEGKMSQL